MVTLILLWAICSRTNIPNFFITVLVFLVNANFQIPFELLIEDKFFFEQKLIFQQIVTFARIGSFSKTNIIGGVGASNR
jgi:hypothetical protein